MMRVGLLIAVAVIWGAPTTTAAQTVTFSRTLETLTPVTIKMTTAAGRIRVQPGPPGRVTVLGTVTVRSGLNLPPNARELVGRVAASPPIEQTADSVALQLPSDGDERRAVTIAYDIAVPPGTRLNAESESGEVSVAGNSGPVTVTTRSGAVTLTQIGGGLVVASGSGPVSIADVAGAAMV